MKLSPAQVFRRLKVQLSWLFIYLNQNHFPSLLKTIFIIRNWFQIFDNDWISIITIVIKVISNNKCFFFLLNSKSYIYIFFWNSCNQHFFMAAINESDKIHLTPVLQTFIYFNQPIELDESKHFEAALNELMTMRDRKSVV